MGRRARLTGPVLVLLAALGGLTVVRLLLVDAPLSADESGFLRIGGQWSPGSSLYGDYWVSRPPGITAIFTVASALGGPTALRLIGLAAALASALLAAGTARTLSPDRAWPPALTGVLVAALLATPNLDVNIVDGEVLALPFLLAGVLCALRAALGEPSRHARLGWAVGAGAGGAAALSVKQNLLDVAVLLAGLVVLLLVRRAWRHAGDVGLGALGGAVAVVVPLLLLAVGRGTSLPALWDAVVLFRFRAAEVLARPSEPASERWQAMVDAFTGSGAPWVLLLLPTLLVPRHVWRRLGHGPAPAPAPHPAGGGLRADEPGLAWVAFLLVLWEAFSVTGGGGYWLHYLVGTVPGLTLVLALSFARLPPGAPWWRWLPRVAVVGVVAWATVTVAVPFVRDPPQISANQRAVTTYLREHADLGRTAIVAFGRASILQEADMDSPYRHLWTVPVLTDDPRLDDLAPVLLRQDATWVVTRENKLDDWGLEDTEAIRVLRRTYVPTLRAGTLQVWRARSAAPGASG